MKSLCNLVCSKRHSIVLASCVLCLCRFLCRWCYIMESWRLRIGFCQCLKMQSLFASKSCWTSIEVDLKDNIVVMVIFFGLLCICIIARRNWLCKGAVMLCTYNRFEQDETCLQSQTWMVTAKFSILAPAKRAQAAFLLPITSSSHTEEKEIKKSQ